MFANLKTPQDLFNLSQAYFKALPKNPTEVAEAFGKVKNVLQTEASNAQSVYATYEKAAKGDASINEIAEANKKAQELMVATRFGMLLAIPGAMFILPAVIETAKEAGVDIVPASVKEEFNI